MEFGKVVWRVLQRMLQSKRDEGNSMIKTEQTASPRLASERRRFVGRLLVSMITGTWLARLTHAAATPIQQTPPPLPNLPAPGDFRQALATALAGKSWQVSESVRLQVPQIAENGAIVPITVESQLPNTGRILVFAEQNPGPRIAEFMFEPGTDAWISLRIKLNDSGRVLAIAESEGQFHGAQADVRVMKGGCG
jgi:sulfur-oxidizing protein SoxY